MIKKHLSSAKSCPECFKNIQNLHEIYTLGDINILNTKKLAVIGSRTMSNYGKNVVLDLVGNIIKEGYTIVSGLATGIDLEAQKLALKLNGKTIGVLGYGFNFLQKDNNFADIKDFTTSANSLIISPFSNSQKPEKHTFVNRNKIIAALSEGVLVIEAVARSGTFYTVSEALNLNKPVFAVPGSIFSYTTKGTHGLIKDGAYLVETAQDVLLTLK